MEIGRDTKSNLVLPCLFFASTGGAYWAAVRIGGPGCGWTNGLMWGLAWRYLSVAYGNTERRAYGNGWFVLALVAGMYFGGMHGYGQFHSWVNGVFHLDSDAGRSVPINALLGYGWNALCGLGWGGVAAVFVAWSSASHALSWWKWAVRILLVAGMAWAFRAFAEIRPDLIMPLFARVDYLDPVLCPDCARTTRTLVESMMWLGFCLGGGIFEAWQRNWRNVAFITTLGLGFAAAFTMFEWFHTLPNLASTQVGWWKYWETSVGTIGGLALGLCFFLFNAPQSTESTCRGRRYPRAELLLGIWLPLLLSGYQVMGNNAPRLLRLFGAGAERFLPMVLIMTAGTLAVIGLMATWWIWRSPGPAQGRGTAAALFVIPYTLMFLVSYIPQTAKAKVWQNWALPIQQAVYGLLFLAGLFFFVWIALKARPATPDLPQGQDAITPAVAPDSAPGARQGLP